MATTNVTSEQSATVFPGAFGKQTFVDTRNAEDQDAGFGLGPDTTPDNNNYIVAQYAQDIFNTDNRNHFQLSHVIDFDLGGIGTTITGLVLKLYGKTMAFSSGNIYDGDAIILKGSFDDDVSSDLTAYNAFTGWESGWDYNDVTEFSSAFGPGSGVSWSTSDYNNITLNSDAVSDANTQRNAGNRFKLYIMNKSRQYDNDDTNLADSTGTALQRDGYYMNYIADKDATNEPTLVVTHDDAAPPVLPTDLKIVGGSTKLNGGSLKVDNN
tara:strand:+ start:2087 stop:2890 length:804 start_codon:yes stop_codon:yes gene_type:complete